MTVEIGEVAEMEGAAELAHDLSLLQTVVMIEHMNVEAALRADHRGEQADRPGAGDQQRFRLPCARAPADALGVIPGLGDDAGRLDQHAGMPSEDRA